MRRAFLLILCYTCLSGCIRDDWAYAPKRLWNRSCGQAVKHAPGFATDVAVESAGSALYDAVDDASAGHETKGERQQRKTDNILNNN
jgi:hypothetical protein